MQNGLDFEQELIRRKIGFWVYCNLHDRKKMHNDIGYDRSKDNAEVRFCNVGPNPKNSNPKHPELRQTELSKP